MSHQAHKSKGQGIGCMGRLNGCLPFQEMSHCPLSLIFSGAAIARQHPFNLFHLDFHGANAALRACQEYDPADFSQRNARFGIFLQGEDILNNNEIWFFGF